MTPLELKARREGLGLSIAALAEALNVAEKNLTRWEFGKNPPRSWEWIDQALTSFEDYRMQLATSMVDEALEAMEANGEAVVLTYASRGDYYFWRPDAREHQWPGEAVGVPVELHRSAAAYAKYLLRTGHDLSVPMMAAPPRTVLEEH